jgi:hypothetical protein
MFHGTKTGHERVLNFSTKRSYGTKMEQHLFLPTKRSYGTKTNTLIFLSTDETFLWNEDNARILFLPRKVPKEEKRGERAYSSP